MSNINEAIQTEIKFQKKNAISALEEIVEKAQTALNVLKEEGSISYAHSDINGIGDKYDVLIRVVERQIAFQQLQNYITIKETN
jgi:hypothetical protein